MLVLGRKQGETIVIGDNVTVTVVKIHANRIELGVEAPREIPVLRGELLEPESEAA